MKRELLIGVILYILITALYSCKKEYSAHLYWELIEYKSNGRIDTTFQDFGIGGTIAPTDWMLICGGPNKGRWVYK